MKKISIVTFPDDVFDESIRIMLVDLFPEQQELVSTALKKYQGNRDLTVYNWTHDSDICWLFDKHTKCNLIIFNANSHKSQLIGYFAAQPRSYYFGNLQDINIVNKREITSLTTLIQLMETL